MTARDRTVLTVVLALVMAGAGWFLLLSPVRKDGKELDTQVAASQARLTAAQALEAQGRTAQQAYEADYAAVSQLGKAVPADDDIPSLVVQLQGAARKAKVDFRSYDMATGAAAAAPVANPAATAAATGVTGATGPTGAAGAVPATQTAAATLPPGAVVGAAGFPTMPIDVVFKGSFFHLQDLLARLDRFTRVRGEDITVDGRLLTVDGFSLVASPQGYSKMIAAVRATAYLLPAEAPATAAIPPAGGVAQPASALAAPTAVASSGGSTP